MLSPNPSVRQHAPMSPSGASGIPTPFSAATNTDFSSSNVGVSIPPPSLGVRAGSISRSSSAAPNLVSGFTADPVMARYHSIKRELEAVESGRSGITPGRAPPATATGGSGLNVSAGLGGNPATPKTTGGTAATFSTGGVRSLYTTPLTPDPGAKAPPSSHVNPVQHFSPVTGSRSSSANVTLPRDQKLEALQRELEQKKILLRDAERERELDRNRLKSEENQLHDAVRRATNERDQATKRMSQLESDLSAERQVNENLRARIKDYELGAGRFVEEKSEYERALAAKSRELQHAQDREVAASMKASEIDSYSNEMKMLQGKIVALESVVAQRQLEVDQEKVKAEAARERMEQAVREKDSIRVQVETMERSASSATTSADSYKKEIQTLREKLEDQAVNETVLKRKMLDAQDEARKAAEQADTENLNHKNLLRERTKEIQRLEIDYVTTSEKLNETESSRSRLRDENAELKRELEAKQSEFRDLQSRSETMRVVGAQESIVKDELRFEVERLKRLLGEQRQELQAQSERVIEHEEEIQRLLQVQEVKNALEGQVQVLRDSISTSEGDAKVIQERHSDTLSRMKQLESELTEMNNLRDHSSQLQATLSGRDITIEKMREVEDQLQASIQELQMVIRERDEEINALKQEFVVVTEAKLSADAQLEDAEQRAAHRNELEGQVEALNKIIDNRSAEVAHLQVEVSGLQSKNRQLELDVETLLEVRNQVDELHNERLSSQRALEDRNSEMRNLEQENASVIAKLKQSQAELDQARSMLNSLEAQCARQQGQLQDKSSLEGKIRQLTNDLNIKSEECSRERERKDDIQARVVAKDEAIEEERRRRMEVEHQNQHIQNEMSNLQVELGKTSVLIDTNERERTRLLTELESKTVAAANATSEITVLKGQMASLQASLESAQHSDNHHQDKIALLQRQLEDSQNDLKLMRESRDSHEVAAKRAENHARTLLKETDNANVLEERIKSLQIEVTERDGKIQAQTALLAEQRERLRELEAEIEGSQRLNERLSELKTYSEKQTQLVSSYEADEQHRTKQLLDRERELGRLREKLATTTADFEAEQMRRRQTENRIRELETECQRASALDGQVAGLNLVISQRTKDVEDERAVSADLRAKLRQAERSTSVRSQSIHMAAEGGDHAKLAVKDEIIHSLQAEEKRRTAMIDQLKNELHRAEEERQKIETVNVDLRTKVDRADATWLSKYAALESELERTKRSSSVASAMSPARETQLRRELDESKRLITTLVSEASMKNSEVDHLRQKLVTAEREVTSVNSTMTDQIRSKASELAQAEHRREEAERLLKEKEVHLSIATENLMAIEKRRTYGGTTTGAPSTPGVETSSIHFAPVSPSRSVLLQQSPHRSATKVPEMVAVPSVGDGTSPYRLGALDSSATIEQELERWREKRRQQLVADEKQSSEYRSSIRASSQ